MEDGILDNLANIEGNVLDDDIVEQGTLGSHLIHVRRRNETRHDEVMPYLRNIGQMFVLEVHGVPFAIQLPLTPPVGQHTDDLGVVCPLIESIKRFRGDRVKIIKLVDRLRAEVYMHPDLFDDIGGEVGIEFLYHTRRSWTRWLVKRPPPLSRNGLVKEIVGVVEALFLDEGPILTYGTKSIGGPFIDKFLDVEIRGWVLTGPTSFSGKLLTLTRHQCIGMG